MSPEEIISDAEIARVHGNANFGIMTPRAVVNDGVRKYAFGFSGGHTQLCILMEHGLITKPRPGRYDANLTKKGKAYARAIWREEKVAGAAAFVLTVAEIANTVGWQAGEPGMEIAGGIVSYLAAHPDDLDQFMIEGGEMFVSGRIDATKGALTWRGLNGNMMDAARYAAAVAANKEGPSDGR